MRQEDRDGEHGQWLAHHGTCGSSVVYAADLALVRATCHCGALGGGGGDCADPHSDIHLHCAHTLVEVVGPPMRGGGTTANVREATCAMWWP